jgi:hypothetical protein
MELQPRDMNPPPDEPDRFEGIRIDLPFVSLRMGRGGWGWQSNMFRSNLYNDDAYERARQRVRARLGFYRQVATFCAVMGAILFLDLVTDGDVSGFVLWLGGIWGAFLVLQLFNTFVFPVFWSQETEERMIEEELRKTRR